jgi:hypothetical protein
MAKYSYDDLTYEFLHSVLTYDSETGELYHKHRPREMFKSDRDWKAWNTRYANKKAGYSKDNNAASKRRSAYWVKTMSLLGYPRRVHRIVWFMYYGEWPKDQIDHINGVATDNRIENLRDVSNKENMHNKSRQANNTSGVTGIYWYPKREKWLVQLATSGKRYHIGYFKDKEDAIAARKEAEKKYGFHENHGRENVNAKGE